MAQRTADLRENQERPHRRQLIDTNRACITRGAEVVAAAGAA